MRIQSLQEQYAALQQNCHEMSEHIQELQDDLKEAHNELRYLYAFIDYKKLEDEFLYFQKNAFEVYSDDLPFPWLTL